ncbi:MAG TPA: MarR family transcriptional regulator [Devosia sp.]|nr:MarR family transcriptional regulator [Devosia sp.]
MSQNPENPIEPTGAAKLAAELRVAAGRLSRRLREEGQLGDFSWSQIKVLSRLERDGPATVTTLAQAEGIKPQSMGATVATLREAGLVRGDPDPNDGRQTVLSLTETYRTQLALTRAAKEDWLNRTIETRLDVAQQAELGRAIRIINRLLDP